MDLITLLKVLVRRWYITAPILGATLVVAVILSQEAPRQFEASGSVLMTTPNLDPSRSPYDVVDLRSAVTDLQSDQGRAGVAAVVGSDDYTIRQVDRNRVEVQVPGIQATSVDTARFVIDELAQLVDERQSEADLPPDERLIPQTSVRQVESLEAIEPNFGEQEPAEGPNQVLGVLFLDDPTAGSENPFGANDATARILEAAVESDEGVERVRQRVRDEALLEFDVQPQGGPGIIGISVLATDVSATLSAFDDIYLVLAEELNERQERAGVPETQRLLLEVLAEPQEVEDITPPLDRAVAAVVGLGGLLAVGLVLLVENLTPAWRRRRSRSGSAVGDTYFGESSALPKGAWTASFSRADSATTADQFDGDADAVSEHAPHTS